MTALRQLKRVRRKLPAAKPTCAGCDADDCDKMLCEGCADDQADEAAKDAREEEQSAHATEYRELYARTLAGIYRDIRRCRIDDALDALDRRVLAELDSAWRTLV